MDDERETRRRKGNGEDPAFAVVDRRPRYDDGGKEDDAGGDGASAAPRHPAYVEELRDKAEQAERRAEEAERRAREISAAYRRIDEERDAFRERLARDLERRVDIARGDLLRKVIEVVDDLDRAIAAARDTDDAAALLTGVTLTRDRLIQVLASEGVEMTATVGRPFDPAFAEAVATEATDDAARDNLVVEEMAKGYTLRGALLRPARVKVARGPVAPATGGASDAPGGQGPAGDSGEDPSGS